MEQLAFKLCWYLGQREERVLEWLAISDTHTVAYK